MLNLRQARLKPATGSTMIMDNKRPARISNFEIGEISAVLGCDRLCSSVGRLLGPGRGGQRPPSDLRQSPLRAGCDLRLLSQLPLADSPRVHHMRTLIQIPPARIAPSLASPFLLQRGNNRWLTPTTGEQFTAEVRG